MGSRLQNIRRIGSPWKLFIGFFILVALIGPLISNDKPIFCIYNGEVAMPALMGTSLNKFNTKHNIDVENWEEIAFSRAIWAVYPYSSNSVDAKAGAYSAPTLFKVSNPANRHILGTDAFGRDVFAGMINGTRIALKVGLFSMLIASLIGLMLGLISGFFGDTHLKLKKYQFVLTLLNVLLFFYCLAISLRYQGTTDNPVMLKAIYVLLVPLLVCGLFQVILLGSKTLFQKASDIAIPIDFTVMRVIELFKSVPNLFLLLAILPLFHRASIHNIIILIGFFSWPSIALFVRAEVLKVREEDYIKIAKLNGISSFRLMIRHVLPNAIQPALITIAFGFASAILAEASLSFLGIGVPINEVTWGGLLTMARDQFSAWWLAVFPGLAIFCTVISFNAMGENLSKLLKK